ncbi:uncharacterized protein MONBRDRAFT_31046 [Monosiga brevicollis MX1]|uniref:SAP domain-containing protein n=1 Tax=Monosiga brevicollis TaxID=81824 RepID=A9UQY1_MONBE|nr:uncharacterized protein MONBRDRAFT_31046 [Monosiga brevicollis MX1]EDQ92677.1 predicted protein [Monosiga brevicollis MX1]|eukprot:XP_001742439.1 hypothetical protein [Monosiga brevicollis MX1]
MSDAKREASDGSDICIPSKLTVDELRDELRCRKLPTTGLKPSLITRLEEALSLPGAPMHCLATAAPKPEEKRKKRASNKKEPTRDEFGSEEEYQLAWTKWRESRDNNNESVKRSRMMAKKKREEQERVHEEREAQNRKLETVVSSMRDEVKFLNKVLKTPELLDRQELVRLEELLAKGMPANAS